MNQSQESALIYRIGLSLLAGIGDRNAKKLIAYCGGAEAVFEEKKSQLLKIPGIGMQTVKNIESKSVLKRAEEEVRFMEKNQVEALFYLEDDYPHRLRQCDDGPILLYKKGNVDLNQQRMLSVVGMRKASEGGKQFCEQLVADLVPFQTCVISGLAYGIDIRAHQTALRNGLPTVCVLAHGLDRIYPTRHRKIAEEMLESGGWISDFLSQTNPDRENFPKRNRIIAGLSDAIVVVESSRKGGSLITAEFGNSYNRDVFAVPGLPKDAQHAGCNYLIKNHKAALLESAKDIAWIMRWEAEEKPNLQTDLFVELTEAEQGIMQLFEKQKEWSIDAISIAADLPMSKTATLLLELEFKACVKSLPGKLYQNIMN